MARTYRNRSLLPKGWTRRDDGVAYYNGNDPGGKKHLAIYPGFTYKEIGPLAFESRLIPSSVHCCAWSEKKRYRKAHYREYKAKVKNLMRHEKYDDILPFRRTGGWLTW